MTQQLHHSGFPDIKGKFDFLFYQCICACLEPVFTPGMRGVGICRNEWWVCLCKMGLRGAWFAWTNLGASCSNEHLIHHMRNSKKVSTRLTRKYSVFFPFYAVAGLCKVFKPNYQTAVYSEETLHFLQYTSAPHPTSLISVRCPVVRIQTAAVLIASKRITNLACTNLPACLSWTNKLYRHQSKMSSSKKIDV